MLLSNLRLHIHLQSLGAAKTWLNAQSREQLHDFLSLIQTFEKYFVSRAKFTPTWTDLTSLKMKIDEEFVAFMVC